MGIGAGIFIFFEVYNKIKNKDNPGPLELEMHQSEKELRDYLRDQGGENRLDKSHTDNLSWISRGLAIGASITAFFVVLGVTARIIQWTKREEYLLFFKSV